MFCPVCNTDLDQIPLGDPCPSCGSNKRAAAPSPGVFRLAPKINTPTVITESSQPDGAHETVVSGPTQRITSRDRDGVRSQDYEGSPTQGEGNVKEALHRLADKLNQIEGERVWKEAIGGSHVSVDGVVRKKDGDETIRCQVTRVERSSHRRMALDGHAEINHTTDELASEIVAAVRDKSHGADPTMALVLDANLAPAHVESQVVEAAVRGLAEDGLLNQWREIWLVGPTLPKTKRLGPTR